MQHLFEKLREDTLNWRKDGYPCQDYPLIGEILRYQFEGEADDRVHLKYLREPQFQSLELYWYLRLVLKTPHIVDLYKHYYDTGDIRDFCEAFGIPLTPNDLIYITNVDAVINLVENNPDFVKLKQIDPVHEAVTLPYPSYIFALAMGTGKTVLIGTIIATEIKRLQKLPDMQRGVAHYRVNNYDASTHLERKDIVIKKYGVQTDRQEAFFDGTLDGTLVKIIDLTKPLTPLDIQTIKDELENRPEESRNITVFCYGINSNIQAELKAENRRRAVNKIFVRDIGSEGITTFEPASAEINFERDGDSVTVTIADYISPTILARMDIDRTIFDEQIDDFRAQIDCVLIDTDYTGEHFKIVESDVPKKKEDFVDGEYTVSLPRPDARVAVKIIDMLGEETVVTD